MLYPPPQTGPPTCWPTLCPPCFAPPTSPHFPQASHAGQVQPVWESALLASRCGVPGLAQGPVPLALPQTCLMAGLRQCWTDTSDMRRPSALFGLHPTYNKNTYLRKLTSIIYEKSKIQILLLGSNQATVQHIVKDGVLSYHFLSVIHDPQSKACLLLMQQCVCVCVGGG